jgi:tetratricopeptide (TPR) repeat protein
MGTWILLLHLAFSGVDPFAKAGAAYDSGQYEEAATLYRDAARRGNQSAIAWFNYGNCLVRLKRRGEAAAAWRKALEWAPRFKRAHMNLAILSEEDGEIGTAIAEYGRLWELDPKDPLPAVRLGEIHLSQNDPMGGVQWFQNALDADPSSNAAHEGLVRAELSARDTATARLALSRWEDAGADTSSSLLFSRALLWERTGDWEAARRSCEMALALDSARVDGWLLLARLLQRGGSDATAVSVLEQASRRLEKEPRIWKALGQSALRSGQSDLALEALDKAWKGGDASAKGPLRQLASWHDSRGEVAQALRVRALLADSTKVR